VGARATLETSIPKAGPYRLLARYEYPFREYHVRMAVTALCFELAISPPPVRPASARKSSPAA